MEAGDKIWRLAVATWQIRRGLKWNETVSQINNLKQKPCYTEKASLKNQKEKKGKKKKNKVRLKFTDRILECRGAEAISMLPLGSGYIRPQILMKYIF